MLDLFQTANLKLSQTNPKEEVRWEPPSDLWYKINNDTAIFESTISIKVGAIIRDHDGQVEAAFSKALLVPLGQLEAEAKTLEESILFASDVGVWDVIFERDSKIVCDVVTRCSEPPSTISTLIEGIRLKLQDFQRARVSHVLRHGNHPAHLLAQYARHLFGYITWIDETPYMVESAVTHDVMLLSLS
ncbi:uncharacterized protein LOC142605778 [Castanea sativa]|uniref:uncharacterized protein LOC142605778 n=1 Tax=Castanea sativa TaxID=21020 RepID=UPI003F649EF6